MPKTYARINENNVVIEVLSVSEDINSGIVGDPAFLIECSQSAEFRDIYPGIGDEYDPVSDCFRYPKPVDYPSWIWGTDPKDGVKRWMPPIPFPGSAKNIMHLIWVEPSQSWINHPDQSVWKEAPVIWDAETQTWLDNPNYIP